MMIDEITRILEELGVKKWKLVEKRVKAKELFFIKNSLDMNRAKDVTKYELTVYEDFRDGSEDYMGSSTILIHPTMTKNEIDEKISSAIFAAKFVKNKPYPLAKGVEKHIENSSETFKALDEIVNAVFTPTNDKSWINSVEIFLNDEKMRILNSNGLDVSFEKGKLEIEFITNSKNDDEEVELYWNLKTSDFSPSRISSKVSQALEITVDRSRAKPTPKVKGIPVIFDESGTKEILSYYVESASALKVYEHMSNAKIGEKIQGDFKGSGITLFVDPVLEGSYFSRPFDEDGFELKKVKLIDDGVLLSYWGNLRFSHYLNVEPTGSLTNFIVKTGKKKVKEFRKEKHIELKTFSDFQMDTLTGDFAGEIRLGWYFDGENRIPITGGSVSGNIKDIQGNFELSNESVQEENYLGPLALKAYNVKIAGV